MESREESLNSTKEWVFFFAFFLTCLSSKLFSMGALMTQAFQSVDPISKSMIVVGSQALAALLAVTMQKAFKTNFPLIGLSVFWCLSSLAISMTETGTVLWNICIFFREFNVVIIASLFLSFVPEIPGGDVVKINKLARSIYVLSFAAGLGLSPFISKIGIGSKLFLIDAAVPIISFVIIAKFFSIMTKNKLPTKNNIPDIQNVHNFLPGQKIIFFIVLLVATINGIFLITEVPILINRFKLTHQNISLIFFATIIMSFVGIRITPTRLLKIYSRELTSIFSILMTFSAFMYLYSLNLVVGVLSVCLLGLFSGVFELASTNYIQETKNHEQRTLSFVILSFCKRIGAILSVFLLYLFSTSKSTNLSEQVSVSLKLVSIVGISLIALYLVTLVRSKRETS